jgi:hypothetical protein
MSHASEVDQINNAMDLDEYRRRRQGATATQGRKEECNLGFNPNCSPFYSPPNPEHQTGLGRSARSAGS